jgi:Chondroitin N-acetylgalactosaminyltransferase
VRLQGFFSRARGLHAAAQAARHRLLIFLDADILVASAAFGARVRQSVAPHRVFFPICYSLNRDADPVVNGDSPEAKIANGYWRASGFGLAAILKEDYLGAAGWDRRLGRWGGEDDDFLWHCHHQGFEVERHRVHELFHQWHPNDIASKEKHNDPSAVSLAGRWRPPPERGCAAPEPGHLIHLGPLHLEPSLERWGFHGDTLRQFCSNPAIAPEETAYFRGVKEYKAAGGALWGDCTTDTAIIRRVHRFRDLFLQIQKNGYDPKQPISVWIGPQGEIEVRDGHHRAAIAVVLGLTISAQVLRRHPAWVTLVDSAWQLYGDQKLYQAIEHPEFSRWAVARDCACRGQAIRKLEKDWRGLQVLDIGSCHGGLAFEMADAGAAVTAAEFNARYLQCGCLVEDRLRVGKHPVSWHSGDGFEKLTAGWDWVLCLSVLHHEVKTGGRERLASRLQAMLAAARRGVAIELATGDETQMAGRDIPAQQEQLGEYLAVLTAGQHWVPILEGVPAENRRSGSDRRWVWAARRPQLAPATAPEQPTPAS